MKKNAAWLVYRDPPASEILGLFWKFEDAVAEVHKHDPSQVFEKVEWNDSGDSWVYGLTRIVRMDIE